MSHNIGMAKKPAPQPTDEPKKPRGRPPVPEDQRKSEMIRVRVTQAHFEKWGSMQDAEERFRTWLERAKP